MNSNLKPEKLRIRPLTPDLWPAVEDLFADRAVCSRCWCMYWRIGSAYRHRAGEENREDFRRVVAAGPPGLLAFAEELAVGWCQVTPRAAVPFLDAKELRRGCGVSAADLDRVWSISCLYVRKGWRRRVLNSMLIEAAVAEARKGGAAAVEAYPLDSARSPSATGTGYASTFARAGFREVARWSYARPVMRMEFGKRERDGRSRLA